MLLKQYDGSSFACSLKVLTLGTTAIASLAQPVYAQESAADPEQAAEEGVLGATFDATEKTQFRLPENHMLDTPPIFPTRIGDLLGRSFTVRVLHAF